MKDKENNKSWKRTFCIIKGRFYITLSNVPLKKKQKRDYKCTKRYAAFMISYKHRYLEEHNNKCPICGQEKTYDDCHIHHVLPYSKWEWLYDDTRNWMVVCRDCHKEIHTNPYLNISLMEAKAKELNINLKEEFRR